MLKNKHNNLKGNKMFDQSRWDNDPINYQQFDKRKKNLNA